MIWQCSNFTRQADHSAWVRVDLTETTGHVRHYVQREARLGDISVAIPLQARSSSLVDFEWLCQFGQKLKD
jgi:hypothetical protein